MTDINQLLDELQDLVDDKRNRVAKLFADIRTAAKDVERYRALRFCGEEFNRYVVVSVNSLVVGSMTYSGDRLDVVADQMIQEQRSMTWDCGEIRNRSSLSGFRLKQQRQSEGESVRRRRQ